MDPDVKTVLTCMNCRAHLCLIQPMDCPRFHLNKVILTAGLIMCEKHNYMFQTCQSNGVNHSLTNKKFGPVRIHVVVFMGVGGWGFGGGYAWA